MPEDVLEELQAALLLRPLAVARSHMEWHEEVFTADSCVQGAGLVVTEATRDEIVQGASFAETRGWTAETEAMECTFEEGGGVSSCSTWSRARWRRPGPPSLRTGFFPYGGDPSIPAVSAREELERDVHTVLFRRSFELCIAVSQSEAKGKNGTENPADPGPPFPSILVTSEAGVVREKTGAFDTVFHQCRPGLEYVKPTQIMSNAEGTKSLALRCNHPRGSHQQVRGSIPSCAAATKTPPKEVLMKWVIKPVPAVRPSG